MSEVTPRDREEKLLAAIAEGATGKLPTPRNRKEKLLKEIYDKGGTGGGGTGGVTPEQVKAILLVNTDNALNGASSNPIANKALVAALADYVKSTDLSIPTKVSELINDKKYQTDADLVTALTPYAKSDDVTEVKESIEELNSNLDGLKYGEAAGGKNLKNVNSIVVKKDGVYITDYLLPIATYTISFVSNTSGVIDFYSKESDGAITGGASCVMIANQRVSKSFIVNSPTRLYSYSNVTATLTEIQIEKGTTATPYEPYIPSVKMLAEEVDNVNSNITSTYTSALSDGSTKMFSQAGAYAMYSELNSNLMNYMEVDRNIVISMVTLTPSGNDYAYISAYKNDINWIPFAVIDISDHFTNQVKSIARQNSLWVAFLESASSTSSEALVLWVRR